jgi:hypothetical protein
VFYAHLKTLHYNPPTVESADVTAWAATIPANGSGGQELYVEIKLDQTIVKVIKAVERNNAVIWDDDVLLYV